MTNREQPAKSVHAAPVGPILDFVVMNAAITINVCTRQSFETGYQLAPRTVPDYNFIFVTRGRVVWVIDGTEHVMDPGDMVLVPPGVPHRGHSLTQKMTLGSVHADVTLPGGRDAFDLLGPPRQMRFSSRSKMASYFRGFLAEFDRGNEPVSYRFSIGWGRLITLQFMLDAGRENLLTPSPIDPIVLDTLRELERRAESPTTLDDLSEWSGFTPQHLNRLFRKTLGVTPLKYLTRLRLERAASLLAAGKLTVRAIAAKLAFEDPYHFSKVFRKQFGQSPAQYRQALESPTREA